MSALSAAAQDEDGDIIKTLQARVADLEAQLYAVGAGGVGKLEQPQSVTDCHQSQPQGEPPGSTESAYQRGYLDGMAKGRRDAAMDAAKQQPPALEQPQGEQQTRYLAGGARYKVVHLKTAGYCIHGLPREMLGQWVAFVDATDNKHMDSQPPQGVMQYQLPDDLYGGSKDWRAGSYAERVEWLHLSYEGAKREIARLEQPQSVTDCHQSQPQGEQEPVAYYVMNGAALFQLFKSKSQADALAYDLQKRHDLSGSLAHFHVVPLYTRPQPPRQPLTEMEIVELRQLTPGTLDVQFVKFARSIEAAHGVKGRK